MSVLLLLFFHVINHKSIVNGLFVLNTHMVYATDRNIASYLLYHLQSSSNAKVRYKILGHILRFTNE